MHDAYIQGNDGRFRPEDSLSRAEAVAMLARLSVDEQGNLLYSGTPGTGGFSDVKRGDWYAPYVAFAKRYGIANGYLDGTFRPDIPITREQFFKITVNFLSVCGYPYEDSPSTSLDHFTDAGELSSYALPCARLLVELGIVKGDGKQLLPKSSTQCQQALAMFFRSYLTLQAWMEDSVDPDGRPEADALVEFALQYVGYNYIWGGKDPSTGFDCSGFVSWVINNCGNGWSVGRLTANGLMGVCDIIPKSSAKPGDLIFFQGTYDTSGASHVGIYVGNGMMIHCGNPISYASIESNYWQQHFYCFGRIRN